MIMYSPGQCRNCGFNLLILDMESTILELEDDGSARSEETIVKVIGKCPNCGKEYKMIRNGLKYEFDSEYNNILHWYKRQLYDLNIQKAVDSIKAPKDNPFFLLK